MKNRIFPIGIDDKRIGLGSYVLRDCLKQLCGNNYTQGQAILPESLGNLHVEVVQVNPKEKEYNLYYRGLQRMFNEPKGALVATTKETRDFHDSTTFNLEIKEGATNQLEKDLPALKEQMQNAAKAEKKNIPEEAADLGPSPAEVKSANNFFKDLKYFVIKDAKGEKTLNDYVMIVDNVVTKFIKNPKQNNIMEKIVDAYNILANSGDEKALEKRGYADDVVTLAYKESDKFRDALKTAAPKLCEKMEQGKTMRMAADELEKSTETQKSEVSNTSMRPGGR